MSSSSLAAYEKWINRHVVDNDGHRVGVVADVYLDDASGYPEWLAVLTGLFGSRISFVPISGAVEAGGKVCVAFSKAFVKDSPNVDTDGTLTVEDEQRLYRHYGMRYAVLTPASDTTVRQADGDPSVVPARRRLRRRHEMPAAVDLRPPSDSNARAK
jgi:sporulation protein YlmC with PRC-barrel domain